MMKHEFETLLGCEVSPEEYEKIEAVYMWLDNFTKEDISKLFRYDEQFVLKTLYSKAQAYERLSQRNTVLEYADANLERVKVRNSVLNTDNDNLKLENYDLRKANHNLQFENNILKRKLSNKDTYIEELETRLQQYAVMALEMNNKIDAIDNLLNALKD